MSITLKNCFIIGPSQGNIQTFTCMLIHLNSFIFELSIINYCNLNLQITGRFYGWKNYFIVNATNAVFVEIH
jgi:hypothetical protein